MNHAGERAAQSLRLEDAKEAQRLQGLLETVTNIVDRLKARPDYALEMDRENRGFDWNDSWQQYKECRDFGIPHKSDISDIAGMKRGGFTQYDTFEKAKVSSFFPVKGLSLVE
jgi:hypothetical protein